MAEVLCIIRKIRKISNFAENLYKRLTKLELEVILIPKNTKQIKYFGIGDDMKSIKRDIYLNRLIARRENGMIKIVTGVRRCGKS